MSLAFSEHSLTGNGKTAVGSTQSEVLIVSQLSDKLDLDLCESSELVEFDLDVVYFSVEESEDFNSLGRFSPLHIQSWMSLEPSGIHRKQVDVDRAHSEQLLSESSAESSTPEPTELKALGLIASEPRGECNGSTKVSVRYDESLSRTSETICSLSRVLLLYIGSCFGDLGGVGRSSNFFQISSDGAGAS